MLTYSKEQLHSRSRSSEVIQSFALSFTHSASSLLSFVVEPRGFPLIRDCREVIFSVPGLIYMFCIYNHLHAHTCVFIYSTLNVCVCVLYNFGTKNGGKWRLLPGNSNGTPGMATWLFIRVR